MYVHDSPVFSAVYDSSLVHKAYKDRHLQYLGRKAEKNTDGNACAAVRRTWQLPSPDYSMPLLILLASHDRDTSFKALAL